MHIERYSFGKILIDGRTYTSDVIVYPDRVDPSWWRKEGHSLHPEDLSGVLSAEPEILIVGTGNSGAMQVPDSTISVLESGGIEVVIERTDRAVILFNGRSGKKVVGAFHLTC